MKKNGGKIRVELYLYDLEDLVIEEMFYDKLAKRLSIFVGS